MKLKTVSVCALLVLLAGCQQENPSQATQLTTSADVCNTQGNMPGGWNEFNATPDAQKAMAFVLKRMDTIASFKQILNVHAQIVSGVNYAIEFELDDGSIWNTVVYRNLDGEYAIIQSPKEGHFCE
ncbi:cystatin domain-containing protein [Vibrio diabolicus]|uniref:cystatin family protein n=1 Tax=Vibrio diabolicus TaxID=50719 RepID=UPI00211AD963|nr:cystatin domain-containing protein [Vibrio diabolicus]MCG9230333.1 cystatin domain-containing protein [Vibrio diabolicus]MCG9572947.1 cystatin domain-containing protein [Vibrio diabolicus]MCG9592944.1 cystatin domain-containing protein [Vibrio diabolicus]MCG9774785.1 cystatin domain-containing protein [Vibrio diabolicus]